LRAVAGALFQLQLSSSTPTQTTSGADSVARPPLPPALAGAPSQNSDIGIAIDDASNLIVIHASQEDLARISDLFTRIDRPQKQVLIEATIVEVTLRDEFRFGIQWDGIAEFLNVTFTDNSSGAVASKFPGISIVYNNVDIVSVLNALDTTTDVQIVSSPRVLALNNQPARIQVGDQVPIVTQSAVSVTDPGAPIVNATSYRDTGIILEVTPHVRAGDMVEIEISQEVSDVSQTVTSGIDSPTISTRRMSGVLAVPDGATVALGGLISSNRSKSNTGVPILKEVPLLGAAFSSQADIVRRTELVVLIRQTILDSGQPELDMSSSLTGALEKVRPSWVEHK
jgi:general secretion pathway protein D